MYLILGELHIPCEFLHSNPEGGESGTKVTDHLSCQGFHWSHVDDLEGEGGVRSEGSVGGVGGRRGEGGGG